MASKPEDIRIRKLLREKKLFYELCADQTLKFGDGRTLKINKTQLAARSDVFLRILCESGSKNVCEIKDYDLPTFKLFLDCLLGFQECSVLDALLVFPIALKYETEEFVSQCINILKPTILNENLCLTLNTALVCNCKTLTEGIKKFLIKNNYIETIFEEEKYYSLLQPESVGFLLKCVEMDSYILQNVFKWAKNYLAKNNWRKNLKSLFKEHKIISHLSLACFETTQALLDFNESELGKDFFSIQDCWAHVIKNGIDLRKSEWVKIRKGDKITEKFVISEVILTHGCKTNLEIFRNKIVLQNGKATNSKPKSNYENLGEDNEEEDDNNYGNTNSDNDVIDEELLHWNVTFKVLEAEKFLKIENRTEKTDKLELQKSQIFKIPWNVSTFIKCHLSVEIVFNFCQDCRILKTSPGPKPIQANDKNMYFTNLIKSNIID